MTQAEISRILGIPKSTCSYITSKLTGEGYQIRDECAGHLKIGLATVALAHGALREIGVRSVAEPALYKLTSETGLSAGIGVLERGRVFVVDRVEGSEFVLDAVDVADGGARRKSHYRLRDQRDIGRELPAHTTSLGKVLMAYLSRQQVLKLIAERGLLCSTPKTIVSKRRLMSELAMVRKQGYAVTDEEASIDVRALSLPIFDGSGAVRAAVSVNGSPSESIWRDLGYLVKLVEAAARDISRRVRFWS